jgi:hypothetical protein
MTDEEIVAEAYRQFPDEVREYTEQEAGELAVLGITVHPHGRIAVDRGNLRYAFVVGAQFARDAKSVNSP